METVINISFDRLRTLMEGCVAAGNLAARRMLDGEGDKMTQRQAEQYLKSRGIRPMELKKMVALGLVKPRRKGKSANSPVIYSRQQVMQALVTIDLAKSVGLSRME